MAQEDHIKVAIVLSPNCDDLGVPRYATEGASGLDLRAAISQPIDLKPGTVAVFPTGIAVSIPPRWEVQIRSRSGLALRGIIVANSPGTIDSDYRGEIQVILANFSSESFVVSRGDRIAQMVLSAVAIVQWDLVPELPKSGRGSDGMGSTGVS